MYSSYRLPKKVPNNSVLPKELPKNRHLIECERAENRESCILTNIIYSVKSMTCQYLAGLKIRVSVVQIRLRAPLFTRL